MARDLGILVCETVAPEFEAVVASEGWTDVRILTMAGGCLQRDLGRSPPPPTPGLTVPEGCDLHHVRCACCPDPALPLTVHDQVAGRRLENCFQLFMPGGEVAQHLAAGAHLVTSGWVTHWADHLARQGLTPAVAREMFQETARSVVLVDTGVHEDAEASCRAFSRCLDLPWTVVRTGLDLTTLFLRDVLAGARAARQAEQLRALRARVQQERASCNLILDLQRDLSSLRDEDLVLARIHDMCATLYAPEDLLVVTLQGQRIRRHHPADAGADHLAMLQDFLGASLQADYRLTPDGRGFLVRFRRGDAVNGGVLVSRLTFPEHRDQYLNQALALAPVCELVISRARALQGILPVCAHCHQIRDGRGRWRRFEEYITNHSDALFSHSVCPSCLRAHYPDDATEIADDH